MTPTYSRKRGAAIFGCGVLCVVLTAWTMHAWGEFYPVVVVMAPAALLLGVLLIVVGDKKPPYSRALGLATLGATGVGLAIGALIVRYIQSR